MKRNKIIISLVLVLIFILVAWRHHAHHSRPMLADTVTVTQGTIVEQVVAVGNIIPNHSITIKAPLSGIVGNIFHFEGEKIKKGDPLLEVKPQPTPENYATAKQNFDEKLINEKAATKDFQGYTYLLQHHAIRDNDTNYLDAKQKYEAAVSERKLAEQNVDLLEKGNAIIAGHVINNSVVSPINGYILDRKVDVGDPVIGQDSAQEANSLFTIADMSDLIFSGQVSEIDAAKIHLNMLATISIAALPDLSLTGKLRKLSLESVQAQQQNTANDSASAAANNSSSDSSPFNVGFKIEIGDFKIPAGTILRAGYSATANIVVNTVKNVLEIPERVVQFDGDNAFVSVMGKHHKIEKRAITLGISDGVNVEVKQGLQLGDVIENVEQGTQQASMSHHSSIRVK